MTQLVYFTITGIFLYLASDWILVQIERRRGAPFPQRSLVFFVIIFLLSAVVFQGIQFLAAPPATPVP